MTIRKLSPRSRFSSSHESHDLLCVLGVEVAGRLVGPDDRGVVDERSCDRDALALAARQLVGHVPRPVGKPDELERLRARGDARFGCRRGRRAAAARRSRRRSAPASGCRTGRRSPCGGRGSRCARGRTSARGTCPSMTTSPSSIVSRPGEAVEQRGLAAAARPHDRDHLAALERQVDAAQRLDPYRAGVVGLHDRLRLDDRRARAHSASFPRCQVPSRVSPARRRAPSARPRIVGCGELPRPGRPGLGRIPVLRRSRRVRGVGLEVRHPGSAVVPRCPTRVGHQPPTDPRRGRRGPRPRDRRPSCGVRQPDVCA